ncbi:MAG: phytanoyl-CoA dioxygenase family protein [Pseudomonadota bacterium]|nr:phytanoyl-CoA dioxygenase family protein [Pseudomonadota bacterium]
MPIPTFQKTDSADDIAAELLQHGVAIVEQVFPDTLVDALLSEARPQLDVAEVMPSDFTCNTAKSIFHAVQSLPSFQQMVTDPLFLAIGDRILGPACEIPQAWTYSAMALLCVESGAEDAQPLHRDEDIYPAMVRRPGDPPIVMGTMFNLNDFSAENGATRFVPDSHTRASDETPAEDKTESAVMPRGSMAFWLGSTFHGFGINKSGKPRLGIPMVSCAGWLRQEENLIVSVPAENKDDYPQTIMAKLGYAQQGSVLGWVPGRNPMNLFEPDGESGFLDLLDQSTGQ